MKIVSLKKLSDEQTDNRQTEIAISWAPVGAKNCVFMGSRYSTILDLECMFLCPVSVSLRIIYKVSHHHTLTPREENGKEMFQSTIQSILSSVVKIEWKTVFKQICNLR